MLKEIFKKYKFQKKKKVLENLNTFFFQYSLFRAYIFLRKHLRTFTIYIQNTLTHPSLYASVFYTYSESKIKNNAIRVVFQVVKRIAQKYYRTSAVYYYYLSLLLLFFLKLLFFFFIGIRRVIPADSFCMPVIWVTYSQQQ